MSAHMYIVNPLELRKNLGPMEWFAPEPYGDNGWSLIHRKGDGSVIVSAGVFEDGHMWVHASMTRRGRVPSYEDLVLLHRSVYGRRGWAYQVFAPSEEHINIHHFALHLWGRVDGNPALPNFGAEGSI